MADLTAVFIITILGGIGIALLLVKLVKLSSHGKLKADLAQKEKQDAALKEQTVDEALEQTLSQELSQVTGSKQHFEEVSRKVSSIFTQELEKRVGLNKKELSQKYESLINEQAKNEEIAWKKYNKVFSEKKRTDAVIRSAAEGLVVVDAKGKVIMMNPAAEKLLGASKKEKIGRPVTEGLKNEQLLSLVKGQADGESREIELVSKQDETKKILRASTAVIENEDGQTVGMVSVLSDITKQKELDQLKANFVASVTHELRTPLVAMEKSISLILKKQAGPVTSTQEEFLSIAHRNLKRLSLLINDLLDLSKLEARKMVLQKEQASIEKAITESIEGVDSWAKTKSIEIVKNVPQGLPELPIDHNRIIQVLTNLIANAIKYTPHAGRISVDAVAQGDNSAVAVSVSDTGIGMAQEELSKVFDKFYQVGERIPTDVSGTGIGLSIAKEIVELHGGKIWVESQKGCGAKFTFTLPLSKIP